MNQLIPTISIEDRNLPVGFKTIEGYDNLYCINQFGDIVSPSYIDKRGFLRKTKVLTPTQDHKGYLRVALNKNGRQKRVFVHRLVAKTFIENHEDKPQVNHLDGDKTNNHVSNLEWCTNQENIKHSYKNGLRTGTNHVGERNNMSKLSDSIVIEIINSDKSVSELAILYSVSKSAIYKIRQRKRWRHLWFTKLLKTKGFFL